MSEASQKKGGILVCHFTSKHRWDDTRIFHNECCSLEKAGYRVVYIVSEDQVDERNYRNIRIIAVKRPKSKSGRVFSQSVDLLKTVRRLPNRPTVCHFHDPELIPAGKVLEWCGYKVVYDMHEIVAQQILDKAYLPRWASRIISRLYTLMERLLTFSMAHIYVTEAPHRRPARAAVLRNMPPLGPQPKRIYYGRTHWELIYVGGVSRQRGAIRMLEVFNHLRGMGKDVRLRILGWAQPEKLLGEMHDYLRGQRLDKWCYLSAGRVEPSKVKQALYEADLGLCLLDPLRNYNRAFPVKVFEYLRAGIPVVATDIDYWRPMVERICAGIQVDISDAFQIAQQIAELLDDPDRMTRMGRNGRTVAERHWSWEIEERQLLALYDDILRDGPGGLFANPSLADIPLEGLELDERSTFRK